MRAVGSNCGLIFVFLKHKNNKGNLLSALTDTHGRQGMRVARVCSASSAIAFYLSHAYESHSLCLVSVRWVGGQTGDGAAVGPPEIESTMKELLTLPGVKGFVYFNESGEKFSTARAICVLQSEDA